jgi:hypothetical protein
MAMGKYGDKRPAKSSEGFISSALTGGGMGKSNEIETKKVNRPDQSINTAFAMDNVKLAMPVETSIKDGDWNGSLTNLDHSLTGASAVNEKLGAKGGHSTIFPNH